MWYLTSFIVRRIMTPGGVDSEPYMVGTVLDIEAGISCVNEATV